MTTAIQTPLGLAHVKKRFSKLPKVMTIDTVRIDPTVAEHFLLSNTHNRPLNRGKVNQHKDTMARGRWTQTGDPIRVSKTGVLLDGQTKLTAIFEAGQTYDYLVVWGLDDEAQDYMDTGSKRSLSHALSLKGENNPNALGGAARIIWQIDNDGTPSSWTAEPTYAEYHEYIVANPEIRSSVQVGTQVAKSLKVPASPIAAAHYYCAQQDHNAADDFFTDLGDVGALLTQDSPVLQLRSTAVKWASRGSVSRMEQASLYDVCVRAFKDHLAGTTINTPYRLTKRPRTYRLP